MRVNLADRVRRNPDRTLTGMDQPDLIAMASTRVRLLDPYSRNI